LSQKYGGPSDLPTKATGEENPCPMVVIFPHTKPHPKTMPKNHRPRTTTTRSISFDSELFFLMEARRKEFHLDRSTCIRYVLQDQLGIVKWPQLVGRQEK
jgi:hypothetical protein